MITTENMADFKTIEIEHDKIKCTIEYVFDGIEKKVQILTINKLPIYLFDEHHTEDFYFAVGEAMIQESLDYKEYIGEQRADEEFRGN